MSYAVASTSTPTVPPSRSLRRPSARVARNRRLVLGVVVALIVLGTVLLAASFGRDDSARIQTQPVATRYHVVEPGDTLWNIALKYQPNEDIRPQVQRWMNERGGRPLQPGERIALP